MVFILQKTVLDRINTEIKTKLGKNSISMQLKYLYIIHRLNYVSIFRKDEYLRGVNMSTSLLTELFGKGSEVKVILSMLEKFQFIMKIKAAKLNMNSASYKLHESISNERVLMHDLSASDSALIHKLEEHNKDAKLFRKQLEMLNSYVSLNGLGEEYFIKKYGSDSHTENFAVERSDLALKTILDGKFFAVRPDIKSRVYTNLTSLPRVHRHFVSINSKPMMMTDISNSQILLTVPLLHKYWAERSGSGLINLPDDVYAFQKLAETGKFYEAMSNYVGLTLNCAEERNNFKKKVFREIWFARNNNRVTAIKKTFRYKFPTVFDIIWKIKENKHNEFAIKLQRFEASILVDSVWKEMSKLGKIVFTLHDAIICNNEEDLFLAETLIESKLLKFGLVPKFKREVEKVYQMAA